MPESTESTSVDVLCTVNVPFLPSLSLLAQPRDRQRSGQLLTRHTRGGAHKLRTSVVHSGPGLKFDYSTERPADSEPQAFLLSAIGSRQIWRTCKPTSCGNSERTRARTRCRLGSQGSASSSIGQKKIASHGRVMPTNDSSSRCLSTIGDPVMRSDHTHGVRRAPPTSGDRSFRRRAAGSQITSGPQQSRSCGTFAWNQAHHHGALIGQYGTASENGRHWSGVWDSRSCSVVVRRLGSRLRDGIGLFTTGPSPRHNTKTSTTTTPSPHDPRASPRAAATGITQGSSRRPVPASHPTARSVPDGTQASRFLNNAGASSVQLFALESQLNHNSDNHLLQRPHARFSPRATVLIGTRPVVGVRSNHAAAQARLSLGWTYKDRWEQ
ncbi:hypothetical protein CF336_g8833 [Tilletia laevis]|nr:hypothetical protein CF336_g8833 [Tilletia laevis]